MGWWVCGYVNMWVGGYVGMWVGEYMGIVRRILAVDRLRLVGVGVAAEASREVLVGSRY